MLEQGAESLILAELAGYTAETNSFEFNESVKSLCTENQIEFDEPVRFLFAFIHEKTEISSAAVAQHERVCDIREALNRIDALLEP